jgi:hypothetical protein
MLTFFELEGNQVREDKKPFSIHFDYEKISFEMYTYTKGEIVSALEELKREYPNLTSELKKRHGTLRKMYRNYRKTI